MSRIDEIKARHYAITLTDGREICFQCVDDLRPGLVADWPCDTAHLLAELAAAQAREQACTERIKDALDCLPRALDGSRPFSLDQRAEVMLAIEALRAALAAAGRGRGDGGR